MNASTKEELDHLNDEILNLFEELEAFVEKEKKFDVHKIPAKTFAAIDVR